MREKAAIFLLFLCVFVEANKAKNIIEFEEWAVSQKIQWKKMEIRTISDKERGVFANETIRTGEEILRIPLKALMSELSFPPDFTVATKTMHLTATNKMALFLIYQKQLPKSNWKPYIDLLPSQVETPMQFSEQELGWLQKSTIVDNTKARKENAKKFYESITKSLFDNKNVPEDDWEGLFDDLLEMKEFSLEEWEWALSILWSRAFSIKMDGESYGCLVPFADMFNAHDPLTPLQVKAEISENFLKYHAILDIENGAEVFMPYGKHKNLSNSELLLTYGFVREKNLHDLMCIRNPFTSSSLSLQNKLSLLEQLNLWREQYCWQLNELPWDLIWATRIILLPAEEMANYKINDAFISNLNLNSAAFGVENHMATRKFLINLVDELIASYETAPLVDEEILQKISPADNYMYYCSVIVRLGEKRMLNEFLNKLFDKTIVIEENIDIY